jgi:hypothetical protein
MTLIAAGQGLRKRADAGYSALANIEARENQMRTSVEMAQKQQETSMLGTGAGIGASYGLKAARAAANAAPNAASSIGLNMGVPTTAVSGGTVAPINLGSNLANIGGNAQAAKSIVDLNNVANIATAGEGVLSTVGMAAPTAPLTAPVVVAEGVSATGAAAGATGATGAAAGGGGAMAGLSALAAPVAIGLGVAFLLNELFD